MYKSKKSINETEPEIKASNLPTKDSTNGKNSATAALKKKNNPAAASPEKPILPERYQVNFLYLDSKKKKRSISPVVTPKAIKEIILLSLTELIRNIREIQKRIPKSAASRVSKNFRFNFQIERPRPTKNPTMAPQNQSPLELNIGVETNSLESPRENKRTKIIIEKMI